MIIYDNDGRVVLDISVDDNSYRHRVIMGDHDVTLHYSLAEHVEIPVGAYCVYQGERYTLERPENFKMKHARYFEYTVTLESYQAKAKIWKFRNPVDGRLKFPLTATPHEHLEMFVTNMNRRDSGWTIGECIAGTEKLISYDHDFCWDAIGKMASEFETEFEFVGKRVSLRKVEYNKSNPLALSYGRGNGFKPGVGRANYGDTPPIEILYVQGGTENIDASKYGNSELLLPKNQTIAYDGEHFEDEAGFNSANARVYVSDSLGLSIQRSDKELSSHAEDSLDCSENYPKRVSKVSNVIVVDAENNFYDIVDNSIPESLNYEDCLIEGETMTIIFQSGMLAGREFEVKYYHDEVKKKVARRFEIVPVEIDGQTMPNSTFAPKTNDTYAVFKCMLPDSYVCDNATKTGASWDMFRSAVKYLFDNEEQKFSFTGELDGIWSKKDWINIGGKIKLGGYVLFSDERFQKQGALVRMTGIKDYINNPHSPEIELSNSTVSGSFSTTLKTLESEEVLVEQYHRDALQFTKRRFRDAQETMSMLAEALLDNFTNSINPITVQTMSLLVGDESLQFRFVKSKTSPVVITHNITYNNGTKQLKAPAGIIQHMTIGINTLSSTHAASEYKYWDIPEYTSARLEDGAKKYYLYAKVSKTTQTGVFLLSETAVKLEGVAEYYHLLVGVLNSEYDEERSFVELYGFTEILPGRVTTDNIMSPDGETYFNLVKGEIGGNIKIKAGSSGYDNLTDKPDLSIYTTNAEFSVLGDKVAAEVVRVNNLTNRIDTAGWITTADGNKLYASKDLENGDKLISYINQTAGSTTIHSSKINLEGAVTIMSLDSGLQGKINNIVSKSDLGSLAFKDAVEAAQLGSTIIVGGYLNADLIKVRRVDADAGFIGGFTIEGGRLIWTRSGYFGGTSRSLKLGSGKSKEGVVNVTFNAETDGRFGVCAIGATANGSAAIYGSSKTNPTYPSNYIYAGYFDGNVEVLGDVSANGFFPRDSNGNTMSVVSDKTVKYIDGSRMRVVKGLVVEWG